MVFRLLYFLPLLFVVSCSKNTTTVQVKGRVSFMVNNGTPNTWTEETNPDFGSFMLMYIYKSTTGTYHLNFSNETSTFPIPPKSLFITFMTNSFITNTPFTLTLTSPVTPPDPYPHTCVIGTITVFDPTRFYHASAAGDFATVTLTKIHNNRADGTFSAKMTRDSDMAVINITNGSFTGIEIIP